MSRISKPIRGCCYPLVSFGLSFLICKALELIIGVWAYLLYLPLFFWFHLFSPIDAFDLWLREYTRDNYWLMTNEGNKWLETEEGKAWLKTDKAQTWLKSTEAEWWVKTHHKNGA